MKTLLTIAYRNILRQKRRTFLSGLTIAVGMMFFAMMDSIMAGMDKGAVQNMIELSMSALKVTTTEYHENRETFPLDYGIDKIVDLKNLIRKNERVEGITMRTAFMGQLSNYTDMTPVSGIVIDEDSDSTVFKLHQYLEGEYFSSESSNEIIMGKDLAAELAVSVGDAITLYALTKDEGRNADEFMIVGLLNTTDPMINRNSVFISYKAGEEFLDLEGLVTEVTVSLKNRNHFEELFTDMVVLQKEVEKEFPTYKAQTFYEAAESWRTMIEQKKGFSYIFLLALLFIAAVGIFNTVLMSVYERIREIGVLRAHGMKPSDLMVMFTMEGVLTGIIGALMGVGLSIGLVWVLVTYGYPIDKLAGDMADTISGFPMWGTIYGIWNIPMILFSGVFSVVVATIAAIIPARKASKMSVTEALRFF